MLDRGSLSGASKMCLCITMETACFIFAIFSSVLSAAVLLVLVIAMNSLNARVRGLFDDRWVTVYDRGVHDDSIQDRQERDFNLFLTFLGVSTVYIYSIISFIFSVFLCYGVHKRRSTFVKLYLIYGILQTTLMMVGAVVYSLIQHDMVGGSFVILGCGIYSLLLLMVQRTYEIIRNGPARHAPLLDSKQTVQA